jgi:hypothetical protein
MALFNDGAIFFKGGAKVSLRFEALQKFYWQGHYLNAGDSFEANEREAVALRLMHKEVKEVEQDEARPRQRYRTRDMRKQ